MTRALITSGAGVIGSHLGEALLEQASPNHRRPLHGSIDNIHLNAHPHFTYVRDRVMNRQLMLEQAAIGRM